MHDLPAVVSNGLVLFICLHPPGQKWYPFHQRIPSCHTRSLPEVGDPLPLAGQNFQLTSSLLQKGSTKSTAHWPRGSLFIGLLQNSHSINVCCKWVDKGRKDMLLNCWFKWTFSDSPIDCLMFLLCVIPNPLIPSPPTNLHPLWLPS